mgnify:CR=1 FL=1
MNKNILKELENIEKHIKGGEVSNKTGLNQEWGGADVIIRGAMDDELEQWADEDRIILGFQENTPKRRLVITKYSRELSWLFEQLRDIFSGQIDYVSKYDFYGALAQSAIDYINEHKGNEDLKELLLAVINTGKGMVS